MMFENEIKKVLLNEEEISKICKKLGNQLSKDYKGKQPIIVGLLKGCHPFMSDLVKNIDIHVTLDYMEVSSYHGTTESSKEVKVLKDLTNPIMNKDIIIAEDIVDTGRTLKLVIEMLRSRGANSVKVVTLLDKPEGRCVELNADYVGTTIPKEFVVGYGLDYQEKYRNMPYVGVLKEEVYTK